MTSTWQKPTSESTFNYDVVESLEYRPIMLTEDISEEVDMVEARENEDFSLIIEDQHQEPDGTPCQTSLASRRIDEGLPFECPLLLIDDESLRNTDGLINSTSIKTIPIEGEKRCTSEEYLVNSTLDRCDQLLAAEIEAVDIQVPAEGATLHQHEIVDDLPLMVGSSHDPENIVELISDAMEGCYVNASHGQSHETIPTCPIEHECWDTQPTNSDLITDRPPETSCFPDGEEDIEVLARESLYTQDELPMCAIQESSEVLLNNNDEHTITPSTSVDEQENKPKANSCPFNGSLEHDKAQTRVSNNMPLDQNSPAPSYRDNNCIFDAEDLNPDAHSTDKQSTLQCHAEDEVGDYNKIDGVQGTCLDKMLRPVHTTANKPASHGALFIESLAPPTCLSYHQAPCVLEARRYHSEGHIEEPECDPTVCTTSSESTTASTAFVKAMNIRNRQKSNIFKNPDSIPMPLLKIEATDLGAVFESGEAKQDPSHECHSDFLKESLHSDENTLSQMSERIACSDSNKADDVDLEGTNHGIPVSQDQTESDTIIPDVTVHPPPELDNNQTKEDHQIVGRRGLENSNETNNEIIRFNQSDCEDQQIVQESNCINNDPEKHCVQNTGTNASTVCNIPPQINLGVLQTPCTKPLDAEDYVDSDSGQVSQDHQTHPPTRRKPLDQPGHLARHDNNPTRVGGARSPSRKVERLRRRELYRMTRDVMLQKDRWERMHQDALRSVDEFNLVRQEVSRLYIRLDNYNQHNFLSEQQCSVPN